LPNTDLEYIHRCFQLAKLAGKEVKSNPNVGAVIVHKDRIIGEGYHQKFGEAHAEINALNSVLTSDQHLIKNSTIYVSLEPCCMHRKTPPCSDAIIKSGIKKVVFSSKDPNPDVDGKSISILERNGIEVVAGVEQKQGDDLIKPFVAQLKKRPYIILKWAQSSDGYIGKRGKQVWLSNEYSKQLSHQWRTEIDGILIGHNTALADNPQLNVRLVKGYDPQRIVLTNDIAKLNKTKLYKDSSSTIFISDTIPENLNSINEFLKFSLNKDNIGELLTKLWEKGIHRLMIEGGSKTLNKFIVSELWDESRILRTEKVLNSGIRAPSLTGRKFDQRILLDNEVEFLYRV